ncbi:glycerophosphodiester phosphodiesterase family protein [uncultured Devosia sp.]|uniref:glycerophosphodiester phosphodiesterase family protein n=1 Tax=uncultured Devosia sp. TaxID=211434 RepID=UPI0035C9BD16
MHYKTYIADPARACAIIAHRGLWRAAPENSLLSIEHAIAVGCNVVEIDVRRSADGELFLLHDDTLERMAGRPEPLETLTAAQLRDLRLRDRDGGGHNGLTDQKLPSLKEAFALTRDRIFLHLDVKQREVIPQVIALARAMGVDQQVDFWGNLGSGDDLAWIVATVTPHGVPFIGKTRLNAPNAAEQLQLLFQLSPFICEIYFDAIEQLAAHQARFASAGIALWVNTLDSISCAGFTDSAALVHPEAVWGRLLDAGVSAIQTDEAAALKTFLAARRA